MTKNSDPVPLDPDSLPDPEDITEADLGKVPPRPEKTEEKKKRFGGTEKQIRSGLKLYRITAWITGIFLLLLVIEMILKYAGGVELFAGGMLMDGSENTLSFQHRDAVANGVNISLMILIVHGWMYVLYLLACFRLWSLMRWNFVTLLAMAGGGVVPFLSFIVERRMHNAALKELAKSPDGLRRY